MFPTLMDSQPRGTTPLAVFDPQRGLGCDITNPIIVYSDEDHGLLSLVWKNSNKDLTETELPPRHRKAKNIKLHGLDGSSQVETSCQNHVNIEVEGDTVTLKKIPAKTDHDVMAFCLTHNGFQSSVWVLTTYHNMWSQLMARITVSERFK